jgi:hypothetical protein
LIAIDLAVMIGFGGLSYLVAEATYGPKYRQRRRRRRDAEDDDYPRTRPARRSRDDEPAPVADRDDSCDFGVRAGRDDDYPPRRRDDFDDRPHRRAAYEDNRDYDDDHPNEPESSRYPTGKPATLWITFGIIGGVALVGLVVVLVIVLSGGDSSDRPPVAQDPPRDRGRREDGPGPRRDGERPRKDFADKAPPRKDEDPIERERSSASIASPT